MIMARLEQVMTERVVLIAIVVVVEIIFLAGCGSERKYVQGFELVFVCGVEERARLGGGEGFDP